MLSESEMQFLLKLARDAIEQFIKTKKIIYIPASYPEKLKDKKGIFVTIYKKIANVKELRGCIGLPYPEKPLIEGVIAAAVSACQDTRFLPLKAEELKDVLIEISILTEPELISVKNPKEYLRKIKLGEDGLIIKKGILSGLFLPQVPIEQEWTVEDYLENLCLKAGLVGDSWLDPAAKIYKFQAQTFSEK